MANIEQDLQFNYASEEAKRDFQGGVESLLELHSFISSRKAGAKERGKEGVFFTDSELEIYLDWIMNTASSLLEHYGNIDRVNRLAMKLYRISQIGEPRKQKAA